MPQLRALRSSNLAVNDAEPGTPIPFVASSGALAADGRALDMSKWDLSLYRQNPVIGSAHDFQGLSLGTGEVRLEDDLLLVDITFDQEDERARLIESKYRRGIQNMLSVSWHDIDADGRAIRGHQGPEDDVEAYRLLEISTVLVGADANALIQRSVANALGNEATRDAVLSEVIAWARDADTSDLGWLPDNTRATGGQRQNVPSGGEERRDVADNGTIEDDAERSASRDDAASAMLAVFDRSTEADDVTRRHLYNTACVAYRWLEMEPPEFVPAAELRALDDETWAGLFLEDEIAHSECALSERSADVLRDVLGAIEQARDTIYDALGADGGVSELSLLDRIEQGLAQSNNGDDNE